MRWSRVLPLQLRPLEQIPVPDDLELIAKTASKLGGERYVSDFHETLNRAAEQAVPAAAELFSGSVFGIRFGAPQAQKRRRSTDLCFQNIVQDISW